jgi:hypothetical protein
VEFAKTDRLLRACAIACRLGFEDEITSSYTTSIHLPGLTELSDEFRTIPAAECHRLVLLHAKCRKEVEVIATTARVGLLSAIMLGVVVGSIKKATPLNYEPLLLAVEADALKGTL